MPAISPMLKCDFNTQKWLKMRIPLTTSFMERMSFKKSIVSSAYVEYSQQWSKMLKQFTQTFSLIRRNRISNARMNKKAEMCSPWRISCSSLMYCKVVLPQLDFWFLNRISIHKRKFGPNPHFPKTKIRNNESKAFSISTLTKINSIATLMFTISNHIRNWSSTFSNVSVFDI